MRKALLLTISLLTVIALAGCEASFSTGDGVDSGEVAEEAQAQLTKASEAQGGGAFPEVTCPDEIKEEVGETTVCHATYGGEKHRITVEVTKNDGDTVDLDFEADGLPPE